VTALSFITANFIARQSGYRIADWGAGEADVRAWFSPLETYAGRFGAMLDEVVELGFDAIDLWTGHLDFTWATEAHAAAAADELDRRGLGLVTYAGWFGSTADEFDRICRLAKQLGVGILGGRTALLRDDRRGLLDALERHDLRFGLENHPERTPADVLEAIGGDEQRIGATVDTGWFGTQGYDAAAAIRELGARVMHVHLKDVAHVGLPHRTCAFGEGVVPLEQCARALRDIGYAGAIAIEHEPEDRDPRPEIARAAAEARTWLG
jgi:L-ribulose-5-phosphate 3-epimerase